MLKISDKPLKTSAFVLSVNWEHGDGDGSTTSQIEFSASDSESLVKVMRFYDILDEYVPKTDESLEKLIGKRLIESDVICCDYPAQFCGYSCTYYDEQGVGYAVQIV